MAVMGARITRYIRSEYCGAAMSTKVQGAVLVCRLTQLMKLVEAWIMKFKPGEPVMAKEAWRLGRMVVVNWKGSERKRKNLSGALAVFWAYGLTAPGTSV